MRDEFREQAYAEDGCACLHVLQKAEASLMVALPESWRQCADWVSLKQINCSSHNELCRTFQACEMRSAPLFVRPPERIVLRGSDEEVSDRDR